MAVLIHPDGRKEAVKPKNGKRWALDEVQAHVGGYVTPIYLNDGGVMLVDEDGYLKKLPANPTAQVFLKPRERNLLVGTVVGPVLILSKSERSGW